MPELHYDGYVNMLNKVGTSKDPLEGYTYQYEEPTPDPELAQIYSSNGIFANIIDKPSELAFKNGYDLQIGDSDLDDTIKKKLAKLKWKQTGTKALKWSRLFGGAAILMGIDDGGDWDEPVNMAAVSSINSLTAFERPEITPDYNSVFTRNIDIQTIQKIGTPEYYMITPMYGGEQIRVHESRLLLFRNGEIPRTSSMSTDYMFFGVPEYNRIKRELRDTVTSHGNGYRLLERCIQAVYKMKNLSSLMATPSGEDNVIKRMQLIDMARSLLNTMVIDSDGEDYLFQTFQLSGVKDIVDESCNMLSAVTNIPQTILFGRSPAGMNSTGESDLSNYYDYVGQIQELNVADNLHYLVDLLLRAEYNSGRIQTIPAYEPVPVPLWNMSEKEKAELEQAKASAELTKAQATQAYVDMQVIDPQEVRRTLAESDQYQLEDVLSEEDLGLELEGLLPPENAPQQPGTLQEHPDAVDSGDMDHTAAAVIVVRDGKILVADRTDGTGVCGPGGHLEEGEQFEDAAFREAMEEFSIRLGPITLIGYIKDTTGQYCDTMIYLCTDFSGEPTADGTEILNARWEPMESLVGKKLFPPFENSMELLMEVLNGTKTKTENADNMDSERVDDDWITMNGTHVLAGEEGSIKYGPPNLKGKAHKPKSKSSNGNAASGTSAGKGGKTNTTGGKEGGRGESGKAGIDTKAISRIQRSQERNEWSNIDEDDRLAYLDDAREDYSNYQFTRNGTLANAIASEEGLNTKPTSLRGNDFDEYVKQTGSKKIYRGVQDLEDDDGEILASGADIRREFSSSDDSTYGGGNYGSGYHFAESRDYAKSFADEEYGGELIECAIKPGAYIMNHSEWQNLSEGRKKDYDFDEGLYALTHGYDGVSADSGTINIVNRGSLVYKEPGN